MINYSFYCYKPNKRREFSIFFFSFFFVQVRLDWIKETENSKLLINKRLKSNLNIFQTLDWSKTPLKYIGSILISSSFRRKQKRINFREGKKWQCNFNYFRKSVAAFCFSTTIFCYFLLLFVEFPSFFSLSFFYFYYTIENTKRLKEEIYLLQLTNIWMDDERCF